MKRTKLGLQHSKYTAKGDDIYPCSIAHIYKSYRLYIHRALDSKRGDVGLLRVRASTRYYFSRVFPGTCEYREGGYHFRKGYRRVKRWIGPRPSAGIAKLIMEKLVWYDEKTPRSKLEPPNPKIRALPLFFLKKAFFASFLLFLFFIFFYIWWNGLGLAGMFCSYCYHSTIIFLACFEYFSSNFWAFYEQLFTKKKQH